MICGLPIPLTHATPINHNYLYITSLACFLSFLCVFHSNHTLVVFLHITHSTQNLWVTSSSMSPSFWIISPRKCIYRIHAPKRIKEKERSTDPKETIISSGTGFPCLKFTSNPPPPCLFFLHLVIFWMLVYVYDADGWSLLIYVWIFNYSMLLACFNINIQEYLILPLLFARWCLKSKIQFMWNWAV